MGWWAKALDGGVAPTIKVIDTQSPANAFTDDDDDDDDVSVTKYLESHPPYESESDQHPISCNSFCR